MRRVPIISGTEYRVRSKYSDGREEVFVLVDSTEAEGQGGCEGGMSISRDTPFAEFLSGLSEGEKAVFREPDSDNEVTYEILGVEVPPVDRARHVSELRNRLLSTAAFQRVQGLQEVSLPADLWGREEFWHELGRENWVNALALAAEEDFHGPFPELQPQGDLLRLVVTREAFPQGLLKRWSRLPADVRFLILAVIVRNKIPWLEAEAIRERERSPYFRVLIDLIVNSRGQPLSARQNALLQFNRDLQNLVVKRAWNSDREIDLTPLLPGCPNGKYAHCEAQDWEKGRDNGFAWCREGPCREAHMTADKTLPLSQWSLPEFLETLQLEPPPKLVRNPREYVTKLGGWINRLNDIRERLRCSSCSEFMEPHGSYSKNLARYHVTVVRCRNDKCPQHAKGVYLSHCWACHRPIDSSRETPIQIEGRYLCAHCGSGPRESETYTQGDVCPACGSRDMRRLNDERRFRCQDCSHTIRVPPQWAITGAGGPEW
jgi:DNA-directed RNA polymerase subunit RPC12/RpoP